eukprot:IDg20116t1
MRRKGAAVLTTLALKRAKPPQGEVTRVAEQRVVRATVEHTEPKDDWDRETGVRNHGNAVSY